MLSWAVFFLLCAGGAAMALELKSSAFSDKGVVPRRYTCEGQNISPDLKWDGVPAATVTFALICDDPDAPMGTWVHWVVYNIPADVRGFREGMPNDETLKDGTGQGMTDFRRPGYGGPCPPPGKPHRYFFKLYALDARLDVKGNATKETVLGAMERHVLGEATLMGTYKR